MKLYFVTNVTDRKAEPPIICSTRLAASLTANDELKNHCSDIGCLDEFDAYMAGGDHAGEWPPRMAIDSPEGGQNGAWANIQDMDFDAHVTRLDDKGCRSLLEMLLQAYCRDLRERYKCPGHDGKCPIDRALRMLQQDSADNNLHSNSDN